MKIYKYTVDDFDLYFENAEDAVRFFEGVHDFLENGRSSIEFDGADEFSASSDDLDNLAGFMYTYYYGGEPDGELLWAIFGGNAEDMLTDEEKAIIAKYDPDSFED